MWGVCGLGHFPGGASCEVRDLRAVGAGGTALLQTAAQAGQAGAETVRRRGLPEQHLGLQHVGHVPPVPAAIRGLGARQKNKTGANRWGWRHVAF